jgi:hypothetical protein
MSYGTNPPLYPKWQEYFRTHQPPTLIVWGKNDFIFPAEGAEPYKRDLKNIDFNLLDTGHFALEEQGGVIAEKIRAFMQTRPRSDLNAGSGDEPLPAPSPTVLVSSTTRMLPSTGVPCDAGVAQSERRSFTCHVFRSRTSSPPPAATRTSSRPCRRGWAWCPTWPR